MIACIVHLARVYYDKNATHHIYVDHHDDIYLPKHNTYQVHLPMHSFN